MKCILVKDHQVKASSYTEQSFEVVECEWSEKKHDDGSHKGWMITLYCAIREGDLKLDSKKETVVKQNYCFYGNGLDFVSRDIDKMSNNFELWFDEDSEKDRKALSKKLVGTKLNSKVTVNSQGWVQLGGPVTII